MRLKVLGLTRRFLFFRSLLKIGWFSNIAGKYINYEENKYLSSKEGVFILDNKDVIYSIDGKLYQVFDEFKEEVLYYFADKRYNPVIHVEDKYLNDKGLFIKQEHLKMSKLNSELYKSDLLTRLKSFKYKKKYLSRKENEKQNLTRD